MDDIRREITVAAPLPDVWAAVTTPEGLAAWLGCTDMDVDARADAPILVRWPDGGTSRGLVEEVDPPRRFVFRWRRLSGSGMGLEMGEARRVTIELAPAGAGATTISVTESPVLLAGSLAAAGPRA